MTSLKAEAGGETKSNSTLSLFEKSTRAQKYLAEMRIKPCFPSVVLRLGALPGSLLEKQYLRLPSDLSHQSRHLHKVPEDF